MLPRVLPIHSKFAQARHAPELSMMCCTFDGHRLGGDAAGSDNFHSVQSYLIESGTRIAIEGRKPSRLVQVDSLEYAQPRLRPLSPSEQTATNLELMHQQEIILLHACTL